MFVRLFAVEGHLAVSSPKCGEFLAFAHKKRAVWNERLRVWLFDPRDLDAVREACRRIYGEDGSDAKIERVWLIVRGHARHCGAREVEAAGRQLWPRPGTWVLRRSDAEPRRISGKLSSAEGVEWEVRDVPRELAERLVAAEPEIYSIEIPPVAAEELRRIDEPTPAKGPDPLPPFTLLEVD